MVTAMMNLTLEPIVIVRRLITAPARAIAAALVLLAPMVAAAATRGPDTGGYTATDAVVYSFVDIASGGASILAGADDATALLTLPFTFSFYGTGYTQVCVSSNGAVYFVTSSGACNGIVDFANTDLTTTSVPGDLPAVLPFWSDLTFQVPGAGAVFYQSSGAPGARKFVIQWDNAFPQGSPNPVTFQLVLSEGTNRVLFQYKSVDLGDGNPASKGGQATIGIRNVNGATTGQQIQWSFDASVVPAESALAFTVHSAPVQPVITWANPAPIREGSPLGSAQLNATVNAPGTLTYTPPAGTLLDSGEYELTVAFTPADSSNYFPATATVPLTVNTTPGRIAGNGSTDTSTLRYAFSFLVYEQASGVERGSLTLEVERLTRRRGRVGRFDSTHIEQVVFSKTPPAAKNPAVTTATFIGLGLWNGEWGYSFTAEVTDAGAPGAKRDRFTITIRSPEDGAVVATVSGPITAGEIQSGRRR